MKNLKKQFDDAYRFSNRDINKFILLMRKGVYPYENMDDSEKFNKTSLPETEDFYSHLKMKDITDSDWKHSERVCKSFNTNSLGEYHDLYAHSDTLLVTDVFDNF